MAYHLKIILKHDTLREIRLRDPVLVQKGAPLKSVLAVMRARRRGCALIQDKGLVIGIFTERDLMTRVIGPGLPLSTPIEIIMTINPTCLHLESSVAEAVQLMSHKGYRHVPLITKDGKICGFVSVRDILDYLAEHFPYEIYNLPPDPNQVSTAPDGA